MRFNLFYKNLIFILFFPQKFLLLLLLFSIVSGGFPKWKKRRTNWPSIKSPPKFSTSIRKLTNDPDIRLTEDTEDPAEDNDCFTEVVEQCDDVCDDCRDEVTEEVVEVSVCLL